VLQASQLAEAAPPVKVRLLDTGQLLRSLIAAGHEYLAASHRARMTLHAPSCFRVQ
jgi:hypothetical protein